MTEGLRLSLARPGAAASAPSPAVPPRADGVTFRDALRDAARGMARREATIEHVLSRRGAPLSPEQLLALQATVHRHSQEVELASKLADKLTGAVRQVLTSQQ